MSTLRNDPIIDWRSVWWKQTKGAMPVDV
jgi:hypothetical protein